jgi:hypothetical protein
MILANGASHDVEERVVPRKFSLAQLNQSLDARERCQSHARITVTHCLGLPPKWECPGVRHLPKVLQPDKATNDTGKRYAPHADHSKVSHHRAHVPVDTCDAVNFAGWTGEGRPRARRAIRQVGMKPQRPRLRCDQTNPATVDPCTRKNIGPRFNSVSAMYLLTVLRAWHHSFHVASD